MKRKGAAMETDSPIVLSSGEEEEEDYYFSEDDECITYDGDSDNDFSLDVGVASSSSQVNYAVLNEEDVRSKSDKLVEANATLLSLPPSHIKALLRHYKWDENRLNDDWFSDENKVREKVGLVCPTVPEASTSGAASGGKSGGDGEGILCGICFETHPKAKVFAMQCGHYFCRVCWASYVENAVEEGPSCLQLKCIQPKCGLLVTEDVILGPGGLLAGRDKAVPRQKYETFSMRSFVEGSRKIKWCPAPGCTKVIESFVGVGKNSPMDVQCSCGHAFCFTCGEESHRPADCEMRRKWVIKNSAESENLNWILANSKPCPKCKRPIEKNYGCMHMTCAMCKYEFCWLCLGPWAQHGERTGGYYMCNKYQANKKKDGADRKRRDFAKASLERYMHYFERWNANKASCTKAKETMNKFSGPDDLLAVVSENTCTPLSQLAFISEACSQVIECRKILMWTYTYGYYNFSEKRAGNMKEFFEFLQGDAEWNLELLHNCIEVELQKFADDNCGEVPRDTFDAFRSKLTGLTKVTKDYFEKLNHELENGLEEINTRYGSV